MKRIGTLVHLSAAAVFVTAGLTYAWQTAATTGPDSLGATASLLSMPLAPPPSIPQFYLDPGNVVMWSLLIAVWVMVLLDAVGQWIDPSDTDPVRTGRPRIWPLAVLALALGATWPMLIQLPGLLTLSAGISAAAAILAARRAAGRHRPAIGFFAGWATAMCSAALAAMGAERFGLSMQSVSAIAILPSALIGMAAQIWIGPSIGYSTAMIWAFCGLAISTMGSDPVIALAAILGISAMAAVLVRAAS